MNSIEKIKTIYNALDEKKAENIIVLDISEISVMADYFIIANGDNVNQVQAMADNVEEQLLKNNIKLPRIEGRADSGWILMDSEDIIIHLFGRDQRSFYDLERLWRDARTVTEDLLK